MRSEVTREDGHALYTFRERVSSTGIVRRTIVRQTAARRDTQASVEEEKLAVQTNALLL